MQIKNHKILIFLTLLLGLFGSATAQNSATSAENDFNNYERGLIQTPIAKPSKKFQRSKPRPKPSQPLKSKQSKNQPAVKPKTTSPEPPQNVGLPGIKVWFERQNGCEGIFSSVAPTSVFTTGDCVRVRFKTNFEGYLTIINFGTSGSKKVIFPFDGLSNRIASKSENYLPDSKGWEFTGTAGNERLFFIVSSSPSDKKYSDVITENRASKSDDSSAVEIYDRDLTPRTENDSVYVMADEQKLEKALIFRLTLKHR